MGKKNTSKQRGYFLAGERVTNNITTFGGNTGIAGASCCNEYVNSPGMPVGGDIGTE